MLDAAESSCPGWRNGGNVVGVERERGLAFNSTLGPGGGGGSRGGTETSNEESRDKL